MINPNNIYIILKGTRYAGNIGAAARAMMNFGLKNMILVSPRCKFNEDAYAKARYAAHIFENAPVYETLDEIAPDFQVLIGTSQRGANRLHMRMSPRISALEIAAKYSHVKTGIVFGDEKAGLSNSDLEKCAWYVTIPSHPDFKSLNLAHSVTVVAYELFLTTIKAEDEIYKEPAESEQVQRLLDHVIQFSKAVKFPNRGSPDRVFADMKRALSSADLRRTDVNLLHGFMRFMEEKYLGGWLEDTESPEQEEEKGKR